MDCSLQASLSMGFSRQEYWSRLPFPSPGDLPHPGIEPASSALAGGFFTTESPGKSSHSLTMCKHDLTCTKHDYICPWLQCLCSGDCFPEETVLQWVAMRGRRQYRGWSTPEQVGNIQSCHKPTSKVCILCISRQQDSNSFTWRMSHDIVTYDSQSPL